MSLPGTRVLFFSGPLYEDLKLWYPKSKIRFEEEGTSTVVAGIDERTYQERTYQGKRGSPAVDTSVGEIAGLAIPGGCPDQLRRYESPPDHARHPSGGTPLACVCHAGWVPISAKILGGGRPASGLSRTTWRTRASPGKTVPLGRQSNLSPTPADRSPSVKR